MTGVAICSGVPSVTAALRADDRRATSASRRSCSNPACAPGCRSSTTTRRRSAPTASPNAVGAYDLYGGPTIVVDFGTANTIEAISAKGEYLGGAIFPGVEISMDALFGRAAGAAARRAGRRRSNVIGKSTVESIQSGVIYGFSGQVDAIVDRFVAEIGECTVVATGGLAELIMPFSRTIQHHEPWLTLHGLRIIFERNSRPDRA